MENSIRQHPDTVAIDLPAKDGTLLHIVLHKEEDTGRFTYSSLVEVKERTPYGLRPLVAYRAGSVIRAPRHKGLGLHDGVPGLLIEGHWLTTLSDWIEMLGEASVDTWKVDAP